MPGKFDVIIGARLGSTAVTAAKKYLPKAKIRMFDDEAQAYQEVINGRAHAVVGSAPTPAFQAIKYLHKLFLPLKGTFTREPIGVINGAPTIQKAAQAVQSRASFPRRNCATCSRQNGQP